MCQKKKKKKIGLSQKMRPIGYDYWNWSKKLEIDKNAGRKRKRRDCISELDHFGLILDIFIRKRHGN